MNPPVSRRRLLVASALLAAWAVVVVARLVEVQLVQSGFYRQRAARQQERTITILPQRGSVFDRDGRELAVSVEASSIFAIPDRVEDPAGEARAISAALSLPRGEVRNKLAADRPFVWIERQVDPAVAGRIARLDLPGVSVVPEARRYFPNGTLAASVLGFVGVDGDGLAGLEYQYDRLLRGREGQMRVARDARQGSYGLTPIPGEEPRAGEGLVLTLDRDLQFAVEQELASGVARTGARDASAVVMDPQSGEILAMASVPSFDPNHFGQAPPAAWRDRAIADSYEPGSVFKVIVGSLVIEDGVARPNEIVDCGNGTIQVGRFTIHDAEHESFGRIPLSEVIIHSSNVGMVRVGLTLGPSRLYEGARGFGIGQDTGVDLPGENPGILREPSRWSELSNASISFGQEVSVTPLQLAVATAVVANGGWRVHPHVVREVLGADGASRPAATAAPVRIISPATAGAMDAILREAVEEGTGRLASVPGYATAGKTGTAQKAVGRGYSPDKYIATFAGYAPAGRPRIVVVVKVDEPRGDYFASEVAAPIFSRIVARAMSVMRVPSDGSVVAPPPAPPQRLAQSAAPVLPEGLEPAALRRGYAGGGGSRMPDLTGQTARTAVAEMARRGLSPILSGRGFVVSQSPAPGERIAPGMVCRIGLSEASSP